MHVRYVCVIYLFIYVCIGMYAYMHVREGESKVYRGDMTSLLLQMHERAKARLSRRYDQSSSADAQEGEIKVYRGGIANCCVNTLKNRNSINFGRIDQQPVAYYYWGASRDVRNRKKGQQRS